jgi:hypothetical protein
MISNSPFFEKQLIRLFLNEPAGPLHHRSLNNAKLKDACYPFSGEIGRMKFISSLKRCLAQRFSERVAIFTHAESWVFAVFGFGIRVYITSCNYYNILFIEKEAW